MEQGRKIIFVFYRIFLLVDVQGYGAVAKQATGLNERSEVREAAEGYREVEGVLQIKFAPKKSKKI